MRRSAPAGGVELPWGRPARGVAVQANGRIVVAGASSFGMELARFDGGGILDPTFGTGGRVRVPTGPSTTVTALRLLDDGRVLVAGGKAGDLAMARVLPGGGLDPTFGAEGLVIADFGRQEAANDAVVTSDGRIVGEATDGTGFSVVYLPSGVIDRDAFGQNGAAFTAPMRAVAAAGSDMVVAGTWEGRVYTTRFGCRR